MAENSPSIQKLTSRPLDSVEDIAWYYDNHWTDYAATYGTVLQAQRTTNVEELLEYEFNAIGFKDGMNVLDAGCGFCGPSIWFAQRSKITVAGLALGEGLVSEARKSVEAAGLSNRISVVNGDFHRLPEIFPEATFDRVFFLEAIGYHRDFAAVMSGVYHVLKPGGSLYIKDWYVRDFEPGSKELTTQRLFCENIYKEYGYKFLNEQAYLAAISAAGLEPATIRELPIQNDPSVMYSFDQRVGNKWFDFSNDTVLSIPCEIISKRASINDHL